MISVNFTKYLKPVPSRYLPRVNLFVDYLGLKIKDGISRASYTSVNSYGARLLIEITKTVDLSEVLSMKDPSDYLLSITKDLEKFIDVRTGKHTTKSLFVNTKQNCFELITPSRRRNPLQEIPLEKDYNHPEWSKIRPLRIIDMSACDLTYKVYNGRLDYYSRGPTYVVYSLDCFALVVKFLSYYKSTKHTNDLDQLLLDFLHNEIIVPTLLSDSVALWLRNVYKQQLITSSRLESSTATIWDNVNIDTLGTDFSGAMVDIQHLKNDLRNENISTLTVLSSLIMSPDGSSFTDYYLDICETSMLPDQQPYVWVECLKHLAWAEFILLVSSYTPSLPDSVSFKKNLLRDIRFWLMMKPYQMIAGSIPYRNIIRAKLEGMYDYLKEQ
jgi:hypothetical protein